VVESRLAEVLRACLATEGNEDDILKIGVLADEKCVYQQMSHQNTFARTEAPSSEAWRSC